ncbi:hypothetical protein GSH03_34920, partial [Burkholderia pseudomallei]|nr:hypothetical protein [Burkholderia pseudomallei]
MPEPPPSTAGVLLFTGPAAPRLRPSTHSAHLPSPRRARFPQSLARRSAPGPFVQRLRFDLPPTNRASRSLVKFAFGEEDEHEEALYGTANHRVSEGSRGR